MSYAQLCTPTSGNNMAMILVANFFRMSFSIEQTGFQGKIGYLPFLGENEAL